MEKQQAKLKSKLLINVIITVLLPLLALSPALCTAVLYPAQHNTPSIFYSPDLKFTLSSIENADHILKKLLEFYWQGLHFPLQFFPKSAFAMYKDKGIENRKNAATAWHGGNQNAGEKDKFEHWLLHRTEEMHESNLSEEFLTISQFIFGEMYANLTEV